MIFNNRKTGQRVEIQHEDLLPTDSDVAKYHEYVAGITDPNQSHRIANDKEHPDYDMAMNHVVMQERLSSLSESYAGMTKYGRVLD